MTMHPLIEAIMAHSQQAKMGVLEHFCRSCSFDDLLEAARALHDFSHDQKTNVYHRVRALLQTSAIYRLYLPRRPELVSTGRIPYQGHELVLNRRFNEAIDILLAAAATDGINDPLASALAVAYHGLGFQVLAAQVQRSVRLMRGNRWMFRTGHTLDYPLRLRRELLVRDENGRFPLLVERTPVRLDLTHTGWSDIFFLSMDFPEGARVLNISVDLSVVGRGQRPVPPITCALRVIDEPVLRLTSVDLGVTTDITDIGEVFDYARDYLGLLKAAVIAAGIIPPGFEGSGQSLARLLEQLVGPRLGLEVSSQVHDIPKGSRLAVSTNLLSGLIAVCMRATRQVSALVGGLNESERRLVAGRAILGEWLGGSGGGWQDSGGVWPGIKLIEGTVAGAHDVEHGSSHGRLLPRHTLLGFDDIPLSARRKLQESLVVVHGGMAANVGPILEMVTEKFLLGASQEWEARQELLQLFDQILAAVRAGAIREFGRLTTGAFRGPLQTIIPWVSNYFTERLISECEKSFGEKFWGFWMMGGMSGGGMGFIFDASVRAEAEAKLHAIMLEEKRLLASGLPFAMDPVVYHFSINDSGTASTLHEGAEAVHSAEYYLLMLPRWLREGSKSFSSSQQREVEAFSANYLRGLRAEQFAQPLVRRLFPALEAHGAGAESLDGLLSKQGFDRERHEQIREDLRLGRIGIAKNRLPADTRIDDVHAADVVREEQVSPATLRLGESALQRGEVAIVSLAAGAGSRWSQGAGTVKALHPFAKLNGRFRTFVEVHLAKSRKAGLACGTFPPHVFTTSYITHDALAAALQRHDSYAYPGSMLLSPGRSIGLRLVPTIRDLRFAWEQMPQQRLEERKEKVRDSIRKALMEWAAQTGEASDYRDNLPTQCIHPVGHWYEVANLLLNGTLHRLLKEQPGLRYLMLHNIDTLGADLSPTWLGQHIESKSVLSFEVIPRRFEDRGGGLARVNGRLRLVEGLAFPREEDESRLSYYNSMTTWISIDPLLGLFGLTREQLADDARIRARVRDFEVRLPTYITLKDVKRRWGNAQEDIFPVTQFEKLWGDMSALADVNVGYFLVSRFRGQQLKDVAQLDTWVRDGSREYVQSLCEFGRTE
jgi:hypothetical protein